jgi:hypothetical protein
MAQITLSQEEAAALRGVLNSYVADLRMEIADTDSWPFRQNLKREALLLKKLLEQLDAELASPATPYSLASLAPARSRQAEVCLAHHQSLRYPPNVQICPTINAPWWGHPYPCHISGDRGQPCKEMNPSTPATSL